MNQIHRGKIDGYLRGVFNGYVLCDFWVMAQQWGKTLKEVTHLAKLHCWFQMPASQMEKETTEASQICG